MAIFSRVFLASGLRNRPSRQDGSWPGSKEEPQRAQAGAGDRRPQSKTFLPDWIPEMSNVMDIHIAFMSLNDIFSISIHDFNICIIQTKIIIFRILLHC